jgi:tetratricopeptide (TPR) repeat protein
MAFWETGKKEEAINDLNYASTIDSDDAVTALPLAISYFTIGMNEDAFRLIQNGIDNPNLNFSQKSAYFSARGLFYQELKDFKKAENDFTKAINFNADGAQFYWNRADLYWNRAHLYFQIQENNKALKDVNQAIYLSPNNFNYLYYRANVFFDVFNDTLNAIRDLKKILSISPSNVEAINLLGNIYQTNGRIDLAIDTYNKGIVLEHSEPYSAAYCYQNRGIIYAEIGELDKAKSDFDKAIFISPNNSDHYVWRGDFYSDYLKQESLAILDYSKAIELDSTNSSLWHSRAYSKEYIDDAGSLSDALHAYNLDTNSSQVMNFLSRLYIKKGYLDSATFILNRAITQQDATTYLLSGSYELMGYINILEENYQTAIKNYNEAIKLTPDDASSYWHRSQVYNRLGDVKAQLKDLNKAIELENNSPSLLSSRGLLYGRLKEYKKADLDFKEAHFKNESKSSVFLLEAKYLMNKQEFLKALTKLDSAILISPKDPEAFFYKALIYEELNKIPQCVHYYTLTHKLLLEKENYFVNDDEDNLMHISEVFNRIGMFYEKIGEYDLMCAVYSLALENLKTDQILRLSEIKEKMKLSVNSHCK